MLEFVPDYLYHGATLILLAAPKAVDYYAHIGMRQHPSAWVLRPGEVLKG